MAFGKVKFKEKCIELLRRIPKGRVVTYAELARAAGNARAARAAGMTMHCNKRFEEFLCFKVVKSDGKVGGYAFGVREKIRRLKRDGVEVVKGKVDLKKYAFTFSC